MYIYHQSGMEEIRVIDNGSGMSKKDLEICFLPHATSKIQQIEDIYRIRSLGFRGEALSSIASSARTEIISSTDDSGEGNTLRIDGDKHEIINSRANKGTIVSVKELFHMFPARKKFLKSPSAETTLCKTTFLEKAASNPDITFRLFVENKLAFFLPASSLSERIAGCYPGVFKELKMCSTIEYREPSFSIKGLLNPPELTRKDRKYIHIYINGRRIQEFSLVQAVCYGYSHFIPGGVFPSSVIFIDVDPQLVDFNIHPAKKEARVKNIRIIHHALSEIVAGKLKNDNQQELMRLSGSSFTSPEQRELSNHDNDGSILSDFSQKTSGMITDKASDSNSNNYLNSKQSLDTYKALDITEYSNSAEPDYPFLSKNERIKASGFLDDEIPSFSESEYSSSPASLKKYKDSISSGKTSNNTAAEQQHGDSSSYSGAESSFRYIGSLFNLFLICEKDDAMYLIDQHAAHEKIIFEKLCRNKADIQQLLIPLYPEKPFIVNEKIIQNYGELGILIKQDDTGDYFIDAMPSYFFEIKNDLLKIISDSPGNIDEIRKNLFATVSCKKAVKKGDQLSADEALTIIDGAFNLEVPFCPHGRPVWKKISKKELLEEINRIV